MNLDTAGFGLGPSVGEAEEELFGHPKTDQPLAPENTLPGSAQRVAIAVLHSLRRKRVQEAAEDRVLGGAFAERRGEDVGEWEDINLEGHTEEPVEGSNQLCSIQGSAESGSLSAPTDELLSRAPSARSEAGLGLGLAPHEAALVLSGAVNLGLSPGHLPFRHLIHDLNQSPLRGLTDSAATSRAPDADTAEMDSFGAIGGLPDEGDNSRPIGSSQRSSPAGAWEDQATLALDALRALEVLNGGGDTLGRLGGSIHLPSGLVDRLECQAGIFFEAEENAGVGHSQEERKPISSMVAEVFELVVRESVGTLGFMVTPYCRLPGSYYSALVLSKNNLDSVNGAPELSHSDERGGRSSVLVELLRPSRDCIQQVESGRLSSANINAACPSTRNRAAGSHEIKVRHLRALGWRVVVVPEETWARLRTAKERGAYLGSKLL